jgi:putative tricarboxylic transport membrane protein
MRAFSAVSVVLAAGYLAWALSLPFGTGERPGPGLYPVLLGTALLGLSIILLGRSLAGTLKEITEKFPRGPGLLRVAVLTAVLFLFGAAFTHFGFIVCSALLVGAALRLFGLSHWGKVVFISAVTSIVFYFLFSNFLEVPLPAGSLFS